MEETDATLGDDDPAAVTVASSPRLNPDEQALTRGASLGRYVVLDRLGAGGMGMVYTAYDPQLDRKVALKLVRNPRAPVDSEGPTRLLREAQAMAKLAHPNVITVHDVGVVDGRVFIAMEFVEGRTLGEWLRERERSWSEILDVFVDAAAGLLAAHEVGIVHRDFKPDNVLIGNDGRVRVMDFGLARANDEREQLELPRAASRFDAAHASLTVTGTVMGTPAYMAPEQHLGLRADARADQFGFCVALYEGLYGHRPFCGDNRHALALAVLEGKLEPTPKNSAVPSWLHAIVLRGLSIEVEQRFASMAELLDAIATARQPPRSRSQLGLGLGLSLGIAGLLTIFALGRDDDEVSGPCETSAAEVDEAWGPSRREAVGEAFRRASLPDAARTTVLASLDEYASAWTSMRRDNCEATRVRASQSDELMDLRTQCLDRRRAELGALVDLLVTGHPAALAKASKSVENLVPVSVCADLDQLRARVALPEDPATRAAVERGEALLADARAHLDAGLYAAALERLDDIEPAALEHAPLAAAVGRLRGATQSARGEYAAAERTLIDAALAAARGHDDRLLVEIYMELTTVVGYALGQPEQAERIDQMTQVALARIGGAPELDRMRRVIMATNTRVAGKPDVAQQQLEQLRDELRQSGDADTELASRIDFSLAALLANRGRYDEAQQLFDAAIAELERRVGADHPALVVPLTNLAVMYTQRHDFEAARLAHDRVVALAERRLGSDHPETAVAYESLGLLHHYLGDLAEARRYLERAVDSYAKNYDAGHPSLVRARGNLSAVLIDLGEYVQAEAVLIECRDALISRFGREHDYLVFLLNNLAGLYSKLGRHDEALEAIVWARSNAEATFGLDNHRTAECYAIEGTVEAAAGQLDVALARFDTALSIYGRIEAPPEVIAKTEAELAAVLVKLPQRAREGEQLFGQAIARAQAAGESGAATVAAIEQLARAAGVELRDRD